MPSENEFNHSLKNNKALILSNKPFEEIKNIIPSKKTEELSILFLYKHSDSYLLVFQK
jgi:hypothetical protein